MKFTISENQLKKILESEYHLDEMTEIVKIFVDNYNWNFPEWVKSIDVKNSKNGDQPWIMIELTFPRRFEVDKLVDDVWLKIYNATNIPTSVFVKR